jgi:uncharacterized OB-fold protein
MMGEVVLGEQELFDRLQAGHLGVMVCPAGHGFLPPHRRCPRCGEDAERVTEVTPEGPVITHTTIAVPATDFAGETPIVVVIEVGPVRVTARWDRDDPPSVGQQAQLWLGAGSPPHLRAGPA